MIDDLHYYQSTARTVLRGAWFYDFQSKLLTDYVKYRNTSIVDIS